ncbi:hypothetical protein T484DRAFT_1834909 [Baffinella frigidus]|nr:hypothetical protein T484DRAFT_1834909 [Cryptophyta sp. CCMP2293]
MRTDMEPRLARVEEGGATLRAQLETRTSEAELSVLREQVQQARNETTRAAGGAVQQARHEATRVTRAAGDAVDGIEALSSRVAGAEGQGEDLSRSRVAGAEGQASRQGEDLSRVHGMVREVVQVIGAMSAQLAEAESARDGPDGGEAMQELQRVYEARFRDITSMIRHIGVSVRAQYLSGRGGNDSEPSPGSDEERGGRASSRGKGRGGAGGALMQRMVDEVRRNKEQVEGELTAVRAIARQTLGGHAEVGKVQEEKEVRTLVEDTLPPTPHLDRRFVGAH